MPIPPPPADSRRDHMLFLVGHGLQTPLSAIRWGCNRLAKMTRDTLTPDQRRVLEGVHDQAKLLSGMLNTLLLVARIDDGTYASRMQEVYLRDFLVSFGPLRDVSADRMPEILCPDDLVLRLDRGMLESLFQAVAVILATSAAVRQGFRIHVAEEDGRCAVALLPPVLLSFVRDQSGETPRSGADTPQLVGGEAGLMLSVVSTLCGHLGGELLVERQKNDTHAITLRLPLPVAVVTEPAAASFQL